MIETRRPFARRLLWFFLLWGGGIAAVGGVVLAIRWAMAG